MLFEELVQAKEVDPARVSLSSVLASGGISSSHLLSSASFSTCAANTMHYAPNYAPIIPTFFNRTCSHGIDSSGHVSSGTRTA